MEEFEGAFNSIVGAQIWFLALQLVIYFGVPLLIVWMIYRYYNNKTNKRSQIIQAIIEKNPDAGNVEELMKKIAPKQKLLKEKLLTKLLWGSILSFLGIGLLGFALFIDCRGGSITSDLIFCYLAGFILLAIGIAFLINYWISKKMLAKEIEAEEKKLEAEANL